MLQHPQDRDRGEQDCGLRVGRLCEGFTGPGGNGLSQAGAGGVEDFEQRGEGAREGICDGGEHAGFLGTLAWGSW